MSDGVPVTGTTAAVLRECDTIEAMSDRGALLVARLHIDLALVSSAACRPQR
jgi:hypothetical protein